MYNPVLTVIIIDQPVAIYCYDLTTVTCPIHVAQSATANGR